MSSLKTILAANPDLNLLSRSKLAARLKGDGISKAEIDAHFKPKELNQIYAPAKVLQPLKITGAPYTFQMDIALLPLYKKANNGVDKFLVLVDIISRKAYCYPLKSGSMEDVNRVFIKFFQHLVTEEDVVMAGVQADDAFNNATFQKTCDDLSVHLVTQVAKDDHIVPGHGDKLGIVDRFVRTIKVYIQKYMLVHHDSKWTVWLPKLVTIYNDTPHVGVKGADGATTPNEMFDDSDFASAVHKGQLAHNRKVGESFDVEVGDTVRVRMGKQTFDKEQARYSIGLYRVTAQEGYRFRLHELPQVGGKTEARVDRLYRPSELLKVEGSVRDRLKPSIIPGAVAKHQSIKKLQKGAGDDKTYKEAEALREAASKPQTRAAVVRAARPLRAHQAPTKLNL